MACEIMNNNFEISLLVFIPTISTNHDITYTNIILLHLVLASLAILEHVFPREYSLNSYVPLNKVSFWTRSILKVVTVGKKRSAFVRNNLIP